MAHRPHKVFEYDSLPTGAVPGRELYLANVDCSLYLDSRLTRTSAARELRRAFDELSHRTY